MPRNASGQYTLPVGNPVVADTLIESDGWANPTMEDLGAEIEDSLSRDGKGSMRAALGIVDGSQANPGLRFIAETGSGLYRNSDGEWWLTVKGVGKIQITESAGLLLADAVTIAGDLAVNGDSTLSGNLHIIGQDDIVQLIVQGDLGQTVNLQEWQDSLGNILAYVDNNGNISIFGNAPDVSGQRVFMENAEFISKFTKFTDDDTGAFFYFQHDIISSVPDPDYISRWRFGRDTIVDELRVEVLQGDGSEIPAFDVDTSTPGDFTVVGSRRRSGSQTANMHEWRDEAGAVMAAIDRDGNFVGGPGGGGSGGSTPDNIGNVPVGAIMHWPLNPPDLGTEWLICDGTSFLVANFPALHAYLGDAYGGDGGTNFNVPDYRGEFLRGQDAGAGVDPNAGTRTDRGDGTTGDNPGTRQLDDFDSHNHGLTSVFPHSNVNIPTGANPRQLGFPPAGAAGTDNAGGDETRPVNVYTVIAIKAV